MSKISILIFLVIKGQKVVSISVRKGRKMSPAAHKRIVAAQKARWAKWRKAQKKS
jgi:hypothetical protein